MHPGASVAALAAITTTVSCYVYGFGAVLGVRIVSLEFSVQSWLLLAGCLALAIGGMALNSHRTWDQIVITASAGAILIALAPQIVTSPALTLAVVLLAVLLVFLSWDVDRPLPLRSRSLLPADRDTAGVAARSAAITAAAADMTMLLFFDPPQTAIRTVGLGVAALYVWRWTWIRRKQHPKTSLLVAMAVAVAVGFAGTVNATVGHLLLVTIVLGTARPVRRATRMARGIVVPVIHRPAAPLVSSFFLLSLLGAVLLSSPVATTTPGGISPIDALFTAVSAVCVTGLIVLDTATDFSGVGQAFILLLIQFGALGIMSYSAAVIIALGRRLRIGDESAIAASLSGADRSQFRRALGRLIAFTFACEALGAATLAALFARHGDPVPEALWRGAFTAISAFANAGFAIQSDSLIAYQHEPLILHVVGILIILGGLSPAAALAIPGVLAGRERRAQIKLILATTGFLLVANFLGVVVLEWNGGLAGLPIVDRLHNGWLQSVTLRTAGFNSIPFDSLRPVTLLVMMASMFIGGSPGGTAGGIKTTTAAVMFLSVVSAIRGNREIALFGRRISQPTVDRAGAIATVGVASLFLTILGLLITQAMPPASAVFEAASALATVGLSVGGTAELDSVGKVVIMLAMFAGRVGPLSLFEFLATRGTTRALRYPAESVDVG